MKKGKITIERIKKVYESGSVHEAERLANDILFDDVEEVIQKQICMETIEVKLLHLPLKAKWYNMQESGEKTEEYREITPYWCKRLLGRDTALFSHRNNYESCNVKCYTHVMLRYGYTKRCIVRRIDSITIGRGNPEWGAPTDRDVFIIKHHKEYSPIIESGTKYGKE